MLELKGVTSSSCYQLLDKEFQTFVPHIESFLFFSKFPVTRNHVARHVAWKYC